MKNNNRFALWKIVPESQSKKRHQMSIGETRADECPSKISKSVQRMAWAVELWVTVRIWIGAAGTTAPLSPRPWRIFDLQNNRLHLNLIGNVVSRTYRCNSSVQRWTARKRTGGDRRNSPKWSDPDRRRVDPGRCAGSGAWRMLIWRNSGVRQVEYNLLLLKRLKFKLSINFHGFKKLKLW